MSRLKNHWIGAAARGLASFLAGMFLICEVLAASGQFHQAVHADGKATANSCVLCMFAKGLVDQPESAPLLTATIKLSIDPTPRIESCALPDFTYLSSPSRAPPILTLHSAVVA